MSDSEHAGDLRKLSNLYRGFPRSNAYVWSPFGNEFQARLRFDGLLYRTEAGSLSQAPGGNIPYVAISKTDTDSQAVLGDSTLIVEKLVEDGVTDDFHDRLFPTEEAHDLALRVLLEDKLYFYQKYYTTRSHIPASLLYLVQVIVGLIVYRKISQTLHGQGTMRYSAEEIASFRQQIWESVDALLAASKRKKKTETDAGDNDKATFWVLGGNTPSEADPVGFGFIAAALVCTVAPESQKVVKSFPAVVDYAQRIHDRYFPDYARWE